VVRSTDSNDARRKRLEVTSHCVDAMTQGEVILEKIRKKWEKQIGSRELTNLEAQLTTLMGDAAIDPGAPGWVAHDG